MLALKFEVSELIFQGRTRPMAQFGNICHRTEVTPVALIRLGKPGALHGRWGNRSCREAGRCHHRFVVHSVNPGLLGKIKDLADDVVKPWFNTVIPVLFDEDEGDGSDSNDHHDL